jgi:hypothetical protein
LKSAAPDALAERFDPHPPGLIRSHERNRFADGEQVARGGLILLELVDAVGNDPACRRRLARKRGARRQAGVVDQRIARARIPASPASATAPAVRAARSDLSLRSRITKSIEEDTRLKERRSKASVSNKDRTTSTGEALSELAKKTVSPAANTSTRIGPHGTNQDALTGDSRGR